jgi:hypothetical protein
LLSPKLTVALPCNAKPEILIPSPFISFPHAGQISMIVLFITSLSFPPLFVFFLHMTFEFSSLVCLFFTHDLWAFLPYLSLLCTQIRFHPTYFCSPFHFLLVHGRNLDSHLPLCATCPWFPMWSFNACTNVLQVWQGPILEIERRSNHLSLNFLLNFFLQA